MELRTASSLRDAEVALRGGIRSGLLPLQQGLLHGLHNRTLILNGVTVTFNEALGTRGLYGGLYVAEVIAQIVAAIPALAPRMVGLSMVLEEATPTSGVTLDKTGTANTLFGFSSGTDTIGTRLLFPPSSTAGSYLQSVIECGDHYMWVEHTEEPVITIVTVPAGTMYPDTGYTFGGTTNVPDGTAVSVAVGAAGSEVAFATTFAVAGTWTATGVVANEHVSAIGSVVVTAGSATATTTVTMWELPEPPNKPQREVKHA